jgi:hypothetical protein
VISGNTFIGVRLDSFSTGNRIEGNIIGLNASGTAGLGLNQAFGVALQGSAGNTIGGASVGARNVISAHGISGIIIQNNPAGRNLVQGNFIGLNAGGTASISNRQDGILLSSVGMNTIGGTEPGTGNVISGNGLSGIEIANSQSNVVQGNLIGTDFAGTNVLPNRAGIFVSAARSNLIGGPNASMRNVISGNTLSGILIQGPAARNNSVQGNFIGTDVSGRLDRGNGEDGIFISGGVDNLIGGASAGAGNLLSGNGLSGIEIWNSASNNTVQGNWIGTDVTGLNALGNTQHGICVSNSFRNTLGGTTPGAGNTIAFNQLAGVFCPDRQQQFHSGQLQLCQRRAGHRPWRRRGDGERR